MAAPTISETKAENSSDERKLLVQLVVVGPGVTSTHHLQPSTSLLVGRDEEADVRIVDPVASRQHARLHVTAAHAVEIEDLGSANGTRLREERLPPKQRTVVGSGEIVTIGSTILYVRRRDIGARPNRIVAHGYFESHLIEECARAEGTRSTFALVRLSLRSAADAIPPDAGARTAQLGTVFGAELRPGDVVAEYGPDEFELLLPDSSRTACEEIVTGLVAGFAAQNIKARASLVFFPTDGVSPGALFGQACAQLRATAGPSSLSLDTSLIRSTTIVANPAMRDLYELGNRVAASAINVLIVGETGVGKDVLAQSLHQRAASLGAKRKRAGDDTGRTISNFVCINCAALAETLLESELFGYEKGAFTGANVAKPGLLEVAGAGTVFLDEIGEMSLPLQAKLLRALESREIMRVGSTQPRRIEARFVAATNRDLEEEIAQKRFRQDLYFRLNGITLSIPPLRERVDEIAPLARRFLETAARDTDRSPPALSAEALRVLERYSWPGNIRELRNVMERALVFCAGSVVTEEHLPLEKIRPPAAALAPVSTPIPAAEGEVRERQADIEKTAMFESLARCGGNQTPAAELLGIPRRTFSNRMKEYGFVRPRP